MAKDNYNDLPAIDAAWAYLEKDKNELKAFSIFKKFKIGLTKEDVDCLERYHEILSGRGAFLKSLGHNLETIKLKAYAVINNKLMEGRDKPIPEEVRYVRKSRVK